jgi:hypothetical protein
MSEITYRVPSRINAYMDPTRRLKAAIIELHEAHQIPPVELERLFGHIAITTLKRFYDEKTDHD